jgi:hypothetical protein
MSAIPIVFIHSGNNDYLQLAVKQAKFFNPVSEVFLLGDLSNQVLRNECSHVLMNRFAGGLVKLKDVYRHSSTNSYEFELNCFARWFILRDFMRENKIAWVCHLDSDFMLYSSVQEYFNSNIEGSNKEAALCIPFQEHDKMRWTASGHVAFVSLIFLEKFCKFVIDVYETNISLLAEKIDYHKKNNVPGGICDMTLLYLYSTTYPTAIGNLLTISNNSVFDHKLCSTSKCNTTFHG